MSTTISKRNCVLGRVALFVTTLIWASSFVILKNTISAIPTLYVLAFRFTGAAVIMLLLGIKEIKKLDLEYLKSGLIMGVLLFGAYVLQTYGLFYTTPGKNAFLTTTYCIIVPFLYWMVTKKKPGVYNIAAALICLTGVGFVSIDSELSINKGDLLTICCGLFFALHIIATNKYVGEKSIIMLTMVQFATAGALSWIFALMDSPFPTEFTAGNIWSIVYLCVMCTAVCYFLQTFGQKYTPPSATALIMTLESVFGAMLSVALGYENLNALIIIGFVLIFAAVVISETKLEFLRFRRKSRQ